jgi:hypothetical protein
LPVDALQVAHRGVVGARLTDDVVRRVRRFDVAGAAVHDDRELTFLVDQG